jgi:subtilisin family serine protease
MVAGVLGAVGNNGKGMTGVAWRVQMMACKCLNNGSGSDSTVFACVDYALANGAQIISPFVCAGLICICFEHHK